MEVKIIADSISNQMVRLTTMHLRYWRPIHSELMTHRVFSRNARSSRAVPVATLLREDGFIPQFGMNQPGMQSTVVPSDEMQTKWATEWEQLTEITRSYVSRWGEEGMHKQHANRPLEWFGWIDVLVTSTHWTNFWALRIDAAAQPELRQLAEAMKKAMDESKPKLLLPGDWHLPYIFEGEKKLNKLDYLLKLSTARCARLSYRPFDGEADVEAEINRYNRLIVSQPVHASPAEHQATPDSCADSGRTQLWGNPDKWGNFHGWVQHRKLIANESVMES